jgi:multiple sugar transport system substrate-binding protein
MMTVHGMLKAAVMATIGFAGVAHAEETVVWWDFLGGGDGVRMKKLIEDFNAAHAGQIKIDATRRSMPRSRPRPQWARRRTS